MMEPIYVLLALLSTFMLSLSLVFGKIVMGDIQNPMHVLIFQLITHFIVLIPIFGYCFIWGYPVGKNITLENIVFVLLSATFFYVGLISMYIGMLRGKASVSGVILASRVIISGFIAFLFLNEQFSLESYFYIVMVVVGVIMVSWDPDLSISEVLTGKNAGSLYFFYTIILFAIGNGFIRLLSNELFLITQLLLRLFFMMSWALITYPYLNKVIGNNQSVIKLLKRHQNFIKLICYVMLIVLSDFGMTAALGESLTITETIAALEGLFAFILMLLFSVSPIYRKALAENLEPTVILVKAMGIILATFGILNFV